MPAADEQQLIQQAQQGSREAFRRLVESHMKKAYDVAYGFVNDHHAAEDIVQEAFVRIFQSLGSFRGEAAFGTWLYRIVTNQALNRVKQMQRERQRSVTKDEGEESMVAADDPADSVEEVDVATHVERALHELPTLQRAVVILRHFDGLSTKEVSGILRCSEGTVKTHLFRGLEKMRKKLRYLQREGV